MPDNFNPANKLPKLSRYIGGSLAWLIDRNTWLAIYEEITKALPILKFYKDQEATDVLSGIIVRSGRGITAEQLFEIISGREIAVVVGCSSGVYSEVDYLKEHFNRRELLMAAADGATEVLLRKGLVPDVVFTDLDGDFRAIMDVSKRGLPVVVHAHGDNVDKLANVELLRGPLVGSTQVEPRPLVYNFGGFTDGDRALFVLYHAGYREAVLVGFDFNNPCKCPGSAKLLDVGVKAVKLAIARRLVSLLEGMGMKVRYLRELYGRPGS